MRTFFVVSGWNTFLIPGVGISSECESLSLSHTQTLDAHILRPIHETQKIEPTLQRLKPQFDLYFSFLDERQRRKKWERAYIIPLFILPALISLVLFPMDSCFAFCFSPSNTP